MNFAVASNGLEATEFAEKESFDIILMDLQMPIMDGYEATKRIKAIQPHTPIIALTAAAILDEKEKAYQAGMDDYITKPFIPIELFKKILGCMHVKSIQT